MRNALIVLAALLTAAACGGLCAAEGARPIVLVFPSTKGEGTDNALAASSTRAVRTYFRETYRVEATVFDRESPTVLRAIMEKKLTADQVASYGSRDQRLAVAEVLGFEYASGAEVSLRDNVVGVKLWLGRVSGGKRASWEVTKSATSGGAGDRNVDNAMQSAVSAAVLEMERQALADLPRARGAEAPGPPDTTAISAGTTPTTAPQPTSSDWEKQGDQALQSGSAALAIQHYSQAVSADPSSWPLRIKLAEAYARKGLFKEAHEELGRATMIGGSAEQIDAAKKRIEEWEAGRTPPPLTTEKPPASDGPPVVIVEPAPTTTGKPPLSGATGAVAKMIEGDNLWNQGKPDEAADAYKEAIRLNPNDWRAYERLAAVSASISLFSESRKALELLKKVQPDPPSETVATRYEVLRRQFDKRFTQLLRQYDSDLADFTKRTITRESYYSKVKALAGLLESMAQFLDVLAVPAVKRPAHLHRSLACGLLAQAATSLLEYLETNSPDAKESAAIFLAQARKETESAATIETNVVIVEKETPPTGATE